MPAKPRLTAEDRALLRQAYREGLLKIVEPDPAAEGSSPAHRLEKAGLLRSVPGITERDGRCRYFALSGAGISSLG